MQIRAATADDVGYLLETELHSLRDSSFWARVAAAIWPLHRQLLLRRYARPQVQVRIACDDEDNTLILGWICFEPTTEGGCLHYVYTRRNHRRRAIARRLLADVGATSGWTYSNWTYDGSNLLAGCQLKCGFNPYAM